MKASKRKLSIGLGAAALLIILLQLSAPKVIDPISTAEIQAPKAVSQILKRACFDCHANQTQLEWYDKIAPASYLVAHDINEARSRFNFSRWNQNPPAVQQVLLWEMVNAIDQGKMPLKRYILLHPESRVSAKELEILKRYVNSLPGRTKVDTAKILRPSFQSAIAAQSPEQEIPISLNGITYTDEYKHWQVISVTDKYDGGSMRVVYGNPVMIAAIKSAKLPFPDGAKMVKVVWGKKAENENGDVLPGNFQNVQLMIKDSKKYRSTQGWGFARFDGLTLKPYGKAGFEQTCINCHRLLVPQNDFVFNIPTKSIR